RRSRRPAHPRSLCPRPNRRQPPVITSRTRTTRTRTTATTTIEAVPAVIRTTTRSPPPRATPVTTTIDTAAAVRGPAHVRRPRAGGNTGGRAPHRDRTASGGRAREARRLLARRQLSH